MKKEEEENEKTNFKPVYGFGPVPEPAARHGAGGRHCASNTVCGQYNN